MAFISCLDASTLIVLPCMTIGGAAVITHERCQIDNEPVPCPWHPHKDHTETIAGAVTIGAADSPTGEKLSYVPMRKFRKQR